MVSSGPRKASDNATSWLAVQPLSSNPVTSSSNEFDPRIATDGSGVWVATWRSNSTLGGTLPPGERVLFSRSIDNGATWSTAAAVDGGVAADSPVIACTDGRWIILWGGKCATSSNGGMTWTKTDSADPGTVVAVQPGAEAGRWIAVRYDLVYENTHDPDYLFRYTVHAIDERSRSVDWAYYD